MKKYPLHRQKKEDTEANPAYNMRMGEGSPFADALLH
jgi:hypothetical protein